MKEIKITLYKFHELSEKAKKKALDELWDLNVDHDMWYEDDFLAEPSAELYKEMDVEMPDNPIFDFEGVSFDLDRGNFLLFHGLDVNYEYQELFLRVLGFPEDIIDNIVFEIYEGRIKNHISFTYEPPADTDEDDFPENYKEYLDSAEGIFEEIMDDALRRLRDYYDYLLTEEAIIETIEANDYDFREDGSLY